MTTIRLRRFTAALAALILGACGTVESFDQSRASIAPQAYVVAFSFDTSALPPETVSGSHWIFDRAFLYPQPRTAVGIAGDQAGLTMVMLEAPGPDFSFGDLRLRRMLEDGETEYYETARKGPEVTLKPGVVTYVGTLTVEDIKLDASSGHPVMLQLRTHDNWENEAEAWGRMYAILADAAPVRNIAADWSGSGSVTLVHRGKSYRSEPYRVYNQRNSYVRTGNVTREKPQRP